MTKKSPTFDTPFDTYTSCGVIGEGGAGRVYVVNNSAGEEFALKCLVPERITSGRLKRFKNEILFCQRHNHSNIVKVLDYGVTPIKGFKCPFYVMNRYSDTLRTLMRTLKPDDIMTLFSQILDGVEAAHLEEVWHRDLKPENVLCEQSENLVLVADFGIAHFEEEELYTAIETKASDRLANFQYSAPEQRVRDISVDHRADIYALGVILNELFTGELLQGTGYKKIADINTDYAYLDDLVELMTQQNPEKRPESIKEIKRELIGRKNEFVAFQKYDEAKKQVVSATEPPEFEPIQIVGFDYEHGVLKLKLSRNVPPDWGNMFRNPSGGISYISGYGPQQFNISGDIASIEMRGGEIYVQDIVDNSKVYTELANRSYVQLMGDHARTIEQQKRAELEKKIADAEMRKKLLATVKL